MYFRPKYPQLKNIVFLDHVGETLRCAMSDILQEELPDGIRAICAKHVEHVCQGGHGAQKT